MDRPCVHKRFIHMLPAQGYLETNRYTSLQHTCLARNNIRHLPLFHFGPHARLWNTTKPSNISQMLRYGDQRRVASFRVPTSDPLLHRGQYMFFRIAWKQHGGGKNFDHRRSETPHINRPTRHSLRHLSLPKLRRTIVRSNSSEWLDVIRRCPVFLPFQCHMKVAKH